MDILRRTDHAKVALAAAKTFNNQPNNNLLNALKRIPLFFSLLALCYMFSVFNAKASSPETNIQILKTDEVKIVTYEKSWDDVYEDYSDWAFYPDILHPSAEDILHVAEAAVTSIDRSDIEYYTPFRMEYLSASDTWIVYFAHCHPDGNRYVGGGINIAIDADTFEILLIWGDE